MKTRLLLSFLLLSLPVFADAQINWEKHQGNPVFSSDSASWASEVANPTVIFDDQIFKMWFSGYEVIGGHSAIGYTESLDGVNWVKCGEPLIFPGNIGAWDLHRYPGCVIRVNDTLKMWYTGSENGNDIFAIGYAYYSVDSAKWVLYPQPVLEKGESGTWDGAFVNRPSVYWDGQTYQMWYYGWQGGSVFNPALIGRATSQDGINWVKDIINNPLISLGPDGSYYDTYAYGPTVLFLNNTYHMWFAGWDGFSTNPHRFIRIGYASSPDGIEWEVQNDNEPVLDIGDPGEWDDKWIRFSSVVIHENQFKIWFDGKGEGRKIGYAKGDSIYNPGITESISKSTSTIYPNPAQSKLTIQTDSKTITELRIYNLTGQLIRQNIPSDNIIDVSGLEDGLYIFECLVGDGWYRQKVVVRK